MLILALIAGAWDLSRWRGVAPLHIAGFAGFLLLAGFGSAALMEWEQRKEGKRWAVSLSPEAVSIKDEKGRSTSVPLSELELVVVTSSQSMWRDDMDISLFDQSGEAAISFPLVAAGGEEFVQWLSARKGFRA
jgi:hypothetical protein